MSNKSAEAFLHQVESGKRTTDAMRVYKTIMSWPDSSIKTISRDLYLPHQTATARLSELCDMGVVYEDNNGYFHITPQDKIGEYAARRHDARYKKWKNLGEKNGWFAEIKMCECKDRIGETKLWCCNQCGARCEKF